MPIGLTSKDGWIDTGPVRNQVLNMEGVMAPDVDTLIQPTPFNASVQKLPEVAHDGFSYILGELPSCRPQMSELFTSGFSDNPRLGIPWVHNFAAREITTK
jgi:hypothetical protein